MKTFEERQTQLLGVARVNAPEALNFGSDLRNCTYSTAQTTRLLDVIFSEIEPSKG